MQQNNRRLSGQAERERAVETRVKSTRILAKLGKFKRYEKRLTVTAWGDARPILDLRYWDISTPEATPGKGMTLTHKEARQMADALSAYLEEEQKHV